MRGLFISEPNWTGLSMWVFIAIVCWDTFLTGKILSCIKACFFCM